MDSYELQNYPLQEIEINIDSNVTKLAIRMLTSILYTCDIFINTIFYKTYTIYANKYFINSINDIKNIGANFIILSNNELNFLNFSTTPVVVNYA